MNNIFDLDDSPLQTYDNISKLKPAFNWLDSLNPQQREAVQTTDGALLVLSGAGTGKTRVLTTRLAYILAEGLANPWNCFVVTFTNKAAKEMKTRAQDMIGSMVDSVWLGTFHSMCVKILRKYADLVGLKNNFTILDEDDQTRLVKQILQAEGIDDKKYPPAAFVDKISLFKDKGLTPAKISAEFKGNLTSIIYEKYQARLLELNAVDFGDILLYTLDILQTHSDIAEEYQQKFKYIMVDEYQDTNVTQYLLLRLLSQKYGNLCCVGDDDQSIYSWRGAEIQNILRFQKDFPTARIIRLEQNYRSTKNILRAASNLIAHNASRLGKTLKVADHSPALLKENEPIYLVGTYSGEEEASFVASQIDNIHRQGLPYQQMAVLVRTAAQMRKFEDSFIRQAIPYQVVGGPKFYERMEIRDMLAYFRVIAQPADDLALERIINKPSRKIGATSVQKFKDYAYAHGLPLLQAIKEMCIQKLISGQLLNAASDLIKHFDVWQKSVSELSLDQFANQVMEESGYLEMLQKEDSVESAGRIENLKELVNSMSDENNYQTLEDFLEHVSLITQTDAPSLSNSVYLMTLHSAKGLEFETVFLPGWEEGLFPHERTLSEGDSNSLEEERRLAYVALTRAKQKIFILTAYARKIFGQWQNNQPSRFLNEIPSECLQIKNNAYTNAPYIKKPSYTPSYRRTSNTQSAKGTRVYHSTFGYGTLMRIEADNKCEVYFDKVGKKMIYGSYLRKV